MIVEINVKGDNQDNVLDRVAESIYAVFAFVVDGEVKLDENIQKSADEDFILTPDMLKSLDIHITKTEV
jgi:hypothetical protein